MRPIRRLLLIRTDRMGDLLMTLPAVHSIRKGLPSAEITLLVQKGLGPLLEDHPDIDRTLTWEAAEEKGWRGILRAAARFRRGHYDAALVFNPGKCFHAACFLAGIPVRVGYRRKLGFLLTASIPDTKAARKLHESEYNLELADCLLTVVYGAGSQTWHRSSTRKPEPALSLPERASASQQVSDLLWAHGLPQPGGLIAIHPWTSNPAKSWPVERFWEVAGELQRQGKTVVVIGGEEAAPFMQAARPLLPASVRDLVGKTPLEILPALLRRCALLISNDSGPIHVAAAVGTPSIVAAPRSHAAQLERWKPLGKCLLLFDPETRDVVESAGSLLNNVQVGIPPV